MVKDISLGYDPSPPGKYKITKVLVDSDFDGIVSAAILRNIYPAAHLYLGNYMGVERGDYLNFVDKQTAVVDMGYISGCGLYFDHHESNKPKVKNFPGRWRNLLSAGRVVYEYFKDVADLKKFAVILDDLDKFDSGLVKLKDVLNPSAVLKLAFSTNRVDLSFDRILIKLLAEKSLANVMENDFVKEYLALEDRIKKTFYLYLKHNSKVIDKVAFVDLEKYAGEKIHSYFITTQFPDIDVLVLFKKYPDFFRATMYINKLKDDPKEYDLLKIAKKINPQRAGGHKFSCGFAFPENKTIPQIEQVILKELDSQK